jgi:hypothetical protein
MTRLDPADRLAALMREQIATLRQRAGRQSQAAPRGAAGTGTANRSSDPARLAAERIRAIDPTDPDRQQKALRAFLECMLATELGSQVVSDPAFPRMVDHVQAQLQADPALAAATQQAAEILLKDA